MTLHGALALGGAASFRTFSMAHAMFRTFKSAVLAKSLLVDFWCMPGVLANVLWGFWFGSALLSELLRFTWGVR